MMFSRSLLQSLLISITLLSSANAHGVLTLVSGANGVKGQGLGVDPSTPRDGSKPNPFEQDTSIIRQREQTSGKAGPCGRTKGGGNNDVAGALQAADASGSALPTASSDGTVTMTLHQVNGDGAGPYTCQVDATATGQNFVAMQVLTNVPGKNSRSRAKATDFQLVAQMPAGTTCAGGTSGACLVRCMNAAAAGPFGGCVMVGQEGAANATAAAPAAAAPAAAAPAAAAPAAAAPVAAAPAAAAPAAAAPVAAAPVAAAPAAAAPAVAAPAKAAPAKAAPAAAPAEAEAGTAAAGAAGTKERRVISRITGNFD